MQGNRSLSQVRAWLIAAALGGSCLYGPPALARHGAHHIHHQRPHQAVAPSTPDAPTAAVAPAVVDAPSATDAPIAGSDTDTAPTPQAQTIADTAVLSATDVELYSEIFQLQDDGMFARADARVAQLHNRVLIGHVLADRYLDRAYVAKYAELTQWLQAYADLPQAEEVYSLALRRRPSKKLYPQRPLNVQLKRLAENADDLIPWRDNASDRRKVAAIQRMVRRYLVTGKPSLALKYLDAPKTQKSLTPIESDAIHFAVAESFYYCHADDQALALAHDIAERRRDLVPVADWIAGLAAWRLSRPETAARHFEELSATRANIGPWLRSAGAYWAARANLVAGVPERVSTDLRLAAKERDTFYGLLALRQLGEAPSFHWDLPAVAPETYARALAIAPVKRAVALAQVGEIERADQEMRRAHALSPSYLDGALVALSSQYQLAAAQVHVAETSSAPGLDGALYPIPPYKPQNGFTVDPALLYAFMRQESRFKPLAKSSAGAQGLMQIMPTTAALVAHDRTLRKRNRSKLYDASYNLRLAQTYIEQLLAVTEPRGNLFMLAVAYNGGPGNLRKWYRGMDIQDDPLLFIESVPSRETRGYVERVLTNLWIYRYRLNKPVPSLDMVVSGAWPVYDAAEPIAGSHADGGGGAAVAFETK